MTMFHITTSADEIVNEFPVGSPRAHSHTENRNPHS